MTGNSEYTNSKLGVICVLRFECCLSVTPWFQHVLENIVIRKYKIGIISPHVYLHTFRSRITPQDLLKSPDMYTTANISHGEERERWINVVKPCIGDDPACMTSMSLSRSFDDMSVRPILKYCIVTKPSKILVECS